MKGISGIISTIIILMITVSLTGTSYIFFSGMVHGKTKESFMILEINDNIVIVGNIGEKEIDELQTFVDGIQVNNVIDDGIISPRESGVIRLDTTLTKGKHELLLISKSMSQRQTWYVTSDVGGLTTTTSFTTTTLTTTTTITSTTTTTTATTTTIPTGNIYFVSTGGNDDWSGTIGQPWRTIQHAIGNVLAGDTIYVRSGTYNENLLITNTPGISSKPITLSSYQEETVTINGRSNIALVVNYGTPLPKYWIIENLNFISTNEKTISFESWGCDGECNGIDNFIIRNNYISGCVMIYGANNLFEGNEVDGSQDTCDNGVWELYGASHHNVYRNNYVHDFDKRGFWSMHRTHDSLWEMNLVHSIGDQCINTDGFGNVEWRHIIRDNTVYDCGGKGIELENTFDSLVENNIVYDSKVGMDAINYGRNLPPPGSGYGDWPDADRCEVGGEYNQYGDTDGDNDCEGNNNDITFRQNLIYNSKITGWSHGIVLYLAADVKIYSNTIYNIDGPNVNIEGVEKYCHDIELVDNIISNSLGTFPVSVLDLNSFSVDDNNVLWRVGQTRVYEVRDIWDEYTLPEYQSYKNKGLNSIAADPKFVNPGTNFHLQSSSPARDAGIDVGITEDIDGVSRPQGSGFDIGVYEYV